MKTKLLLMLVIVGLVAGLTQANMLKNPSFEEGVFEANTAPEEWTLTEDEGTSQFTWFDDAAGAHWGSRYIKVNTWTGWLGTSGFVWQTVDVTADQQYAFSVWAKCPFIGEISEAWAWCDWLDYAGAIVSGGWLPRVSDVGSNWTHVEFGTVTAPTSAKLAVYYLAGVPENVLMGILFDDAYMGIPLPSFPSPAWEAKVPIGDVDLNWTNLIPSDVNDVYVDVLFGTEPNETDPAYDMAKIVDATTPEGEDANSVTVEDLAVGKYYWRVNSYLYGDPATTSYETNPGDPNIIKGHAWSFDVVADAPPSSVDAGPDMITWDGQAVQLDATVVDDGQSPLTYAWNSDTPVGTDILFSATDIKNPTVTISKISSSEAAIVNPSFEDRLNGWDQMGVGHGTWTGVWGGKTHIIPTDGEYAAFVDGTQGDPIEGGWLSQTLTETLSAETKYTLTVDVVNDGFYNEDVEYKVQLLAGETVIAEDDDNWPLPLGSGSSSSDWQTSTVVYTVGTLGGPSDPNLAYVDQPLGIRLIAKAFTQEMNFDNVHLTADPPFPVPERTSVELTVSVNDEANPTPVKDAVTIDVYSDACTAARVGLSLAAENPGDVDVDCDTDFYDLDEMVSKWLSDTGLTEAVESLTADSLSGSLQVQFKQDAAANSQDGFDQIVSDETPLSGVVDGVTITADGTHVRSHTHSSDYLLIDHTDGDLDNLLSGGVLSDDPDVAVVLTLAGLADGDYSITTYHHSQYDDAGVVNFDVQLTDASGTDVLIHDDIDNSVGTPVITSEITMVETPFTVSGRNDVTLTFTQASDRLKLNGFVLEMIQSNDPNISVNAGVDMVTLSGETVTLAGTAASDAYGDENLVLKWSASPPDGVVFSDDTSANSTVTITKATNDPSSVVLTLQAADVADPSHVAKDWLVIDVYNDACLAAKSVDPGATDTTDIDADCDTDIEDFAVIAEDWLVDYELTEPVEKP
jgi:hypothetical protein